MVNPLKKTMAYLGLTEEGYDDPQNDERHEAEPSNAPVTPLRRQVAPIAQVQPGMNEILTVHPRNYEDVSIITERYREGVPVIINISQMSDQDARRLIDFSSGLAKGLGGKIERAGQKVFLLLPAHIVMSGDESETVNQTASVTQ